MRLAWIAIAGAFWAATASAQENVSVPYAPTVPARFAVAEVMTNTDGETVSMDYSLELLSQIGDDRSYEAVWTVLSVAGHDASRSDELNRLVGRPIAMRLGEAGQPTWMSEGDYFSFASEQQAALMSQRLATPLTFMAVCHNANSPIGQPVVAQGERQGEDLAMTWRMERQLQSVAAGVARLTFMYDTVVHQGSISGEIVHRSSQRVQCIVDAQTGIARSVSVESTTEMMNGEPFATRFEISVSPR
ncbi:MAG: hypothetical protein NT015_15750 [Alphaproteobacteria bacterium]|nr:hypothetical protein [Alphaproteobacteria bacterium]